MPVMNGFEMMAAYHEYLISSSSSFIKIPFFVGSSATDSLLGKETLRENGKFIIMMMIIIIIIIIIIGMNVFMPKPIALKSLHFLLDLIRYYSLLP
jgi:hypothetical protein